MGLHLAIPVFLVLAVFDSFVAVGIDDLLDGNVCSFFITVAVTVVVGLGYHVAAESAIGFLNLKNYSFSNLADDISALGTHIMNFLAVAGFFLSEYSETCVCSGGGRSKVTYILLMCAFATFLDLLILGLYKTILAPIGLERIERERWLKIQKRKTIRKKFKPLREKLFGKDIVEKSDDGSERDSEESK